jgi:hypothetical protein
MTAARDRGKSGNSHPFSLNSPDRATVFPNLCHIGREFAVSFAAFSPFVTIGADGKGHSRLRFCETASGQLFSVKAAVK